MENTMDRNFKRRELEHELRHEDEWNKKQASMPKLLGYYFYNVPSNDVDTAASYGIKKLKSGKYGMPIYDKSGNSTAYRKRLADDAYGKGKWWEPKSKVKEAGPTSTPTVGTIGSTPGSTSNKPSTGTVTNVSKDNITIQDPKTKVSTTMPVNPQTQGAFSKSPDGKLIVDKTKLSQAGSSSQQTLAKPGQQVQINNSVEEDNELATIMRHAGLQ